jgi:hypothetical protein
VLFAQIKSGAFDFPSPYWDSVSDGGTGYLLLGGALSVEPC